MARETLTRRQMDNCRKAIQTTQLINRLQDNAEGKIDPPLTSSQVKGIEVLLNKALPNLQSVDSTVRTDDKPTMTAQELDAAIADALVNSPEIADKAMQGRPELARRMRDSADKVLRDCAPAEAKA